MVVGRVEMSWMMMTIVDVVDHRSCRRRCHAAAAVVAIVGERGQQMTNCYRCRNLSTFGSP